MKTMKYPIIIFYLIIFTLIVSSCTKENKDIKDSSANLKSGGDQVSLEVFAGSCPYLTNDNNGSIVLSWVRDINDSQRVMSYAVSTDKGKTFETPVSIPGSETVNPHSENMPKIIFKPDGTIIAFWGVSNPNPKNPYSGLVYYSQSVDQGKNWTKAKSLSNDSSSIDQRYYDVALLPDGKAAVIWLDARTKTDKEGSTLYYAVDSGANGFENEKPIEETCCQCCRTNLLIDSKGNINITYRDIIQDSIRDIVHSISTDGGKTFSPVKRISYDNWYLRGCPHAGPDVSLNKETLNFVWFTMGSGTGVFYCQSTNNGNSFSAKNSINNSSASRHPQIASFENGTLAIVWDESIKNSDNFTNKIGLQYRSSDGNQLKTQFITADTLSATFPVLNIIDNHNILVAYTQQINKRASDKNADSMKNHDMNSMNNSNNEIKTKNYVLYQVVSVEY